MALVQFKMIADESEPSLCANFSDSSSSVFTDDEYDINKLLRRRTSVSLFNVSTPLDSSERYQNQTRFGSHYNIHSNRKKRQYKPYSNDKKQNKTKEEPEGQRQNNTVHLTPDISIKYAQALQEIETLQMQINKFKSEQSTPIFVRTKNMQSSMIKTCLFKNSSTVLRSNQHNLTRSSLFGTNSTCMTLDIEDKSPQPENEIFNNFLLPRANPFIKVDSPISDKSFNNSKDPLISNVPKTANIMRNFFHKFIKCPEFLQKIRHNKTLQNKVSPMPKIFIISPETGTNDSGNDSEVQQIRLEDFNCNTPDMERIMKDMSKCADQLAEKLNSFRNVLEQYRNKKSLINSS